MHSLAYRPDRSRCTVSLAISVSILAFAGCGEVAEQQRVTAAYDSETGKLRQLTVNASIDGKPNITSYMDGTKFVRIEIDANEDGRIDRWEYYGANQKLHRVGSSRADDGIADAWVFQATDGSVDRVEVSTHRDGRINRTEFYEHGAMTRAEEDTDTDGRVDKWERYESGALVSVSFDTTKSGKPTTTIDYRQP